MIAKCVILLITVVLIIAWALISFYEDKGD